MSAETVKDAAALVIVATLAAVSLACWLAAAVALVAGK